MKRFFTILLIAIIFLCSVSQGFAYKKQTVSRGKVEIQREIQKLIPQVRLNNVQIYKLKYEMKKEYKKAKYKIQNLLKQKEKLTADQIRDIKKSIEFLKENNGEITKVGEQYNVSVISLKKASSLKDMETAKNNINKIISMQKTRIEQLKKIYEELRNIKNI
ncbi:MAG: hypothetical protein N2645_14335 [Clostridia bacterium]|nr:hypothetical protein [Clostridia bacterium]